MDQIVKTKLIVADYLRYNRAVRALVGCVLAFSSSFRSASNPDLVAEKVSRLATAARLCGRGAVSSAIERAIHQALERFSATNFDWDRFFPDSKPRSVERSIILKAPNDRGEKGVLFVAFEYNWLRLLRYANVTKLAERYDLVISPTWSPPHDLPFLLAYRLWPCSLVTILSNHDDERVFQRLAPGAVTVPLLASSWANPKIFKPRDNLKKSFDVVMLANFAAYKRHFALFRTISKMRRDISVLILGRKWGSRTRFDLEREARMYGVLDRITVEEGLPDDQMIMALQSSKVSLIMSMGEGACVAVAESLLADVPTALLEGANVGSRAFINHETGCFLRRRHVAHDLERFISEFSRYSPRKWMIENDMSCVGSSRILNDHLRALAVREGRPWTTNIAEMHWRPYPKFSSTEDRERLQKEFDRFEGSYGIPIRIDNA